MIEWFPVGRTVAFDAWKGRLWAVCPRCSRWNLAPIEERWEAVEWADRLFQDTRMRVQSENIGLARMPDGSRLVRVGEVLPGELAAWRYGGELRKRRRRFWIEAGVMVVVGLATGVAALPGGYVRKDVLYVVHRDASPVGRPLKIRGRNLNRVEFHVGGEAGLRVLLPRRGLIRRVPSFELDGRAARILLERTITAVNQWGASRNAIQEALAALAAAPSVASYVGRLGATDRAQDAPVGLRIREWAKSGHWRCQRLVPGEPPERARGPRLLALEMALHEDLERRALEGELADLEARWREAEAIARIADAL